MATATATIAARLDRLPPSRYFRALVTRISLGGWFEFYDLFMTAYIALGLIKAKLFVATGFFEWQAFASFVGAGFAGMFVGTLIFSYLSDHYGRKFTFTYSLLWYSVATIVMAFMNTPFAIDLWRFLAGIGIGVQLVTIDAYIAEITPKETRGYFIAYSQLITYTAVPIVALISYLLVPQTIGGLEGWRWVVIIGGLGAVFIWFVRLGLPESPRWYDIHGHHNDAEQVMSEMESRVRSELGQDLPVPHSLPDESTREGSWTEIWTPRYIKRTVMLVVFNFFQTIGFYGFAAWVPILLFSEGVTFVHSLEYTFIIAILNPLGPLIGMYYADRLQRKWQIVGLSIAIAVFGLIFSQMRTAGLIILFGVLITLANNWFSAAFHVYQAELYPTRIRAQAVGFVYSWSRFSSIFIGFLIALALKNYGAVGVFTLIACAMAVVAIDIAAFGPKTTGERLEAISA